MSTTPDFRELAGDLQWYAGATFMHPNPRFYKFLSEPPPLGFRYRSACRREPTEHRPVLAVVVAVVRLAQFCSRLTGAW